VHNLRQSRSLLQETKERVSKIRVLDFRRDKCHIPWQSCSGNLLEGGVPPKLTSCCGETVGVAVVGNGGAVGPDIVGDTVGAGDIGATTGAGVVLGFCTQ